ncbi:hypothetical protein D3C79_161710 [compost metagenome]
MKIVCDGVVRSTDLELADPEMLLNLDSSLATYSLQDKYDSSGNGRDLITGNDFTEAGMLLVDDAEHGANTGVIETDEMTFAICINVDNIKNSGRIFSSFVPGVAPFSGIQLRIEPNGALIFQVASGEVGGAEFDALYSVEAGGAVGGWTRFTATVSNSEVSITRSAGKRYAAKVKKRAKSSEAIILNGAPSQEQNKGLPGVMGVIAFYDRVLTEGEQELARTNLKEIMRTRGHFVN